MSGPAVIHMVVSPRGVASAVSHDPSSRDDATAEAESLSRRGLGTYEVATYRLARIDAATVERCAKALPTLYDPNLDRADRRAVVLSVLRAAGLEVE